MGDNRKSTISFYFKYTCLLIDICPSLLTILVVGGGTKTIKKQN